MGAESAQGGGLDRLLGGLEREIMELLWLRGETSVRDVFEALNARRSEGRQLAYTTVMTVMARLADKGLLARHLVGKAHAYRVTCSRDMFLASASENLARQLVEDFGEAAIAGFVNVLQRVAPERLAALRRRARVRDADAFS
ncbi:MAG: BlaI/MecI/CopY family transcriptional regulator [Chloroflexi bacterium]|nr:BlaI/MecI/CopY family transcriptional regulator [Chloroflexota bacterium]